MRESCLRFLQNNFKMYKEDEERHLREREEHDATLA